MTGLMGIALPLFASPFYQTDLQPSGAMALWSHAARRALPGGMIVAAITIFGAMRFGGRALTEAAAIRTPGTPRGWALLGCLVVAIAWCSLHPDRGRRAYELTTNP